MRRTYRVVVAGGDDPSAAATARALRDGGFEVIVIGRRSPAEVAEVCLQEDADAVGAAFGGLLDALTARGLDDLVVFDDGPVRELTAWLAQALDERDPQPSR